jgi:hypothetical protein
MQRTEAPGEAVIAKTESRSLLGALNDFTHMLQLPLPHRPDLGLGQTSLALSHTPVGRLRPTPFPDRMTTQLLT